MASGDLIQRAAPLSITACGIPATAQVSGRCATTGHPLRAMASAPAAPSCPIPVRITAPAGTSAAATLASTSSTLG